MSQLLEIGFKINKAIEAVWKSGLTIEEIERLETYINQQEVLTPLLNPNFVVKLGFKIFDQAKERIKLLKPIIQLKEKKEDK